MSEERTEAAPARVVKRRNGYKAALSARTWLHAKVSNEVYYAVLAEAKRTGKRTTDVVAAIVKRWHLECLAYDQAVAKAKKNPAG